MAAGPLDPAHLAIEQPAPTPTPREPGIEIASAKFDLPDPYLLNAGGTYYLYFSTGVGDDRQHVPVLTGEPDHWSEESIDAVPQLPSWVVTNWSKAEVSWSPSVYKVEGIYVMYFAPTVRNSQPLHHCIAVATSSTPTGPFQVDPNPFVCQWNQAGDIDPQLFVDPNGPDGPSHPNYFVWKSDNNSFPGGGTPGIWAQPMSNDGLHLTGQPVRIYSPDQGWQMSLVEAPQMALSPAGTVWLFYSAGVGYFSSEYGIGAVGCDGPLGPCTDQFPGPLITTNAQGSGPGEETYFVGPDGSNWLLYSPIHAGLLSDLERPVEAARIGWNQLGPYVAASGRFPRPS
jgi:GH43 family beta-xylosidase